MGSADSDEICAVSVRAYAWTLVFAQTTAFLLCGQWRAAGYFSRMSCSHGVCVLEIVVQHGEQVGDDFTCSFSVASESKLGRPTPGFSLQSTTYHWCHSSINICMIVIGVVGVGRRYEYENTWVSAESNSYHLLLDYFLWGTFCALYLILKTKVVKWGNQS